MRLHVDHFLERLCYFIVGTAISAWALMILIGMAHGATGWPPRTASFVVCLPAAILLRLVTVTFTLTYD